MQDKKKANSKSKPSANKVLVAGTKVDVPVWLGKALADREIVELKKPLFLTTKYFNTVRAGADVVTMKTVSPYLFEVVFKLC